MVANGQYTYMTFAQKFNKANGGQLSNTILQNGYAGAKSLFIQTVYILGVPSPSTVNVNNQAWKSFTYNSNTQTLTINSLSLSLASQFVITWN